MSMSRQLSRRYNVQSGYLAAMNTPTPPTLPAMPPMPPQKAIPSKEDSDPLDFFPFRFSQRLPCPPLWFKRRREHNQSATKMTFTGWSRSLLPWRGRGTRR